ncbi:MAG TPA: DNA translocase FtsK [Bacilli bacterium]|nr:DNA translocase FtsK [Bacilli bacterium]
MKNKQAPQYQTKSLKKLFATIIALIATIGLLNRSIGSFVTYTFYYLFGTVTPLFFILVIIASFVFINKLNKSKRFYILIVAFVLATLTLSALFYQYSFPHGGYEVFVPSLVRLSNYMDFYAHPNHLFETIHGGALGGLIYSSLYALTNSRVLPLVVILTLFFTAIVFIFWPVIIAIFKNIATYMITLRHRNKVIRSARIVPALQTISPLKANHEIINNEKDNNEKLNYFGTQLQSSSVKRAVFGEDAGQEVFTFSPIVVDISKANQTKGEEINADELLNHVNAHELVEEQQEETYRQPQPYLATPTFERKVQGEEVKALDEQLLLQQIYQEETIAEQEQVEIVLDVAKIEPTVRVEPKVIPASPFVKQQEPVVYSETPQVAKAQEVPKVVTPKKIDKKPAYVFPSLDLLNSYTPEDEMIINNRAAEAKMLIINNAFNSFNLGAQAISYTIGPSITRFDIKMDEDKSVTTLNRYINDLNIRLQGQPGRFEEIVTGRVTSGFEVPNEKKVPVTLRDCIFELPQGEKFNFAIPFGKNIDGRVIWGLLDEFPHLLVAGSTGSGKSVFVHALLVTLLMRTTPEQLKLLIIDPKRVEMNKYKEIPHLLCPIVKEAKDTRVALDKLVEEMEQRYRLFEQVSANKLAEYNSIAKKNGDKILPRIVVIIDEYADLIDNEKDISVHVLRLAQKSRAAGIHLIVATQRPSTVVITGQIKANLPTRVALMTASAIDSTVILGQGGAEELLGNGDMLVDCTQISRQGFTRIQGAYVDNDEIRAVTDYLKQTYQPDYAAEFLDLSDKGNNGFVAGTPSTYKDEMYEDVKSYVLTLDTISINRIQITFNMAYNRAKMIYEALMAEGVISPPDAANSSRGAKVIPEYELSPEEIKIDNNDY